MACKYNAPSGTPSSLFNDLYEREGLTVAIANHTWFNSTDFKDWYKNGNTNNNGEPIVKNGQVENEIGEILPIKKPLNRISKEEAEKQVEQLNTIFANRGVAVKTTQDDISDEAYVVNLNGEVNVFYNPNKVREDTIFHEYGHIYVDVIGYNDPMIQRGIKQLKDTEFWNRIKYLNPELNEEQLGKEVLTTAIGIEAAKRHDELKKFTDKKRTGLLDKIEGWLFWANQFFRRIGDILGINKDVASMLAYDLTSGKLRNRLTGTVSTYKQFKKDSVKAIEELLNELSVKLVLHESGEYYTSTLNPDVRFDRVTNAISKLEGHFDRQAAIIGATASRKPLYEKYTSASEIEKLWADKREEGSAIHNIAEQYIKGRNAGRDKNSLRKTIISNLPKPDKAGQLDEDGIRFYQGMNEEQVSNYIDTIFGFIDNLYDKGYTLFSEVPIASVELNLAGTIDLLAVDIDGNVEIFDFKTKELVIKDDREHTAFDTFNKIDVGQPTLLSFMSDVPNSTANHYGLQLSTYKMMLQDLGINVKALHVVPLVGEVEFTDNQYNYKNLKLYTGSNAKQFNKDTGTFILTDFSERLKNGWLGKEDLEQTLNTIQNEELTNQEFEERLRHITNLEKWIIDAVTDLHRSIGRVSATSDKYTAEQYKAKIEGLIDKLLVTDELEAIASYTKFLTDELLRMRKKMFSNINVDKKGVEKTWKGYADLTWQQIKELETNNPEEYYNFIAFIANAGAFLDQVITIQDLPFSVDGQINEVRNDLLKKLKDLEPEITNLKFYINKLNRELDLRYPEMSSNPHYTQGDTLKAMKLFLGAQKDETWMQANLDALADTHHPYIANVIKAYNNTMYSGQEEVRNLLEGFGDNKEGIDINKLVQSNGKLLNKIDYDSYYKNIDEMYKEAADKFGKGTNAYYKFVNQWYARNTEIKTKDEISRMESKKKKELSPAEFILWKKEQHYQTKNPDSPYYKKHFPDRRKAYYKPKESIYQNVEYSNLTDKEKEFLNYLQNTLSYLVDHVKDSIIESGYIPAVPNDTRGDIAKIKSAMGWHDAHKVNPEGIFDKDGEMIHILPFKFNSLLNQQEYETIYETDTEDVKQDKKKKNDEIKALNEAAHGASIDLDLNRVIPMFIRSAVKHKYKKGMQFELQRVYKSMIDNHKIAASKNGTLFFDKNKIKAGAKEAQVEKSTINSKILEHYKDWLKMVFYEEFEVDEGTWTKVARVLQNYTSFKGLALNPFSAINNQVYGKIMSRIEAAGGEFYSIKDWLWSKKEYDLNMLSYFADRNEEVDFSSKPSAFFEKFPILMDVRERGIESEHDKFQNLILRGISWGFSKSYALQNVSEHFLQSRLLLSMAHSHKIVDNKIINYTEYERGKLKSFNVFKDSKEDIKRIREENKETVKSLKEKWNKHTNLYDAFDFENKRLKLKDEFASVTEQEFAEFQQRVLGVNQYIHGIYNKEDAGAIQQYALGRLAIQFRKWMRPGWTKRWGSRVGEDYWNERRRHTDEGYYMTTLNFLKRPYTKFQEDLQAAKENDEQITMLKALGNLVADYGRFVFNVRVHWASLNAHEKTGVVRTMLEWVTLTTSVGLLYLLKEMKGDDDEPPYALLMALYQMDRTVTEMTTYVPIAIAPPIPGVSEGYIGGGIFNETKKLLKSPTATFNTIENLFKIGIEIMNYPFYEEGDELYKNGQYHGKNKLWTHTQKMIPLYNQFFRGINLDANYKYYKLF